MSTITRGWIAFAAIGTGLIHLALVVGAPLPFGVAFAVCGATELGWGVLAMARTRLPVPRAALVGALLPLLLWIAVLLAAITLDSPAVAAPLHFLPMGVATILELFAALTLVVSRRRERSHPNAPASTNAAKYLIGLMIGSLVVAALTTPALAATEAGRFAKPHGEHTGFIPNSDHGGHR